MKKIYLFLLSFFFAGTQYAYAESVFQFPSFLEKTNSSPADFVNDIYLYAISIAGTLAIIMTVYGGVKYVVTGGNTAAQKDALEIIKSAVWGILLLAGAFVILNTINPQLTVLKNPGLVKIAEVLPDEPLEGVDFEYGGESTGGVFGGTSKGCRIDNMSEEEKARTKDYAAKLVQENSKSSFINSSSNCGKNDNPLQNIKDVLANTMPVVCDWDTEVDGFKLQDGKKVPDDFAQTCTDACKSGSRSQKATLCPNMLGGLLTLREKVTKNEIPNVTGFTITSISGYLHSANSVHYQGRAFDIVPYGSSQKSDAYEGLQSVAKEIGATFINNEGDHLHLEFGGADSPAPGEEETLKESVASLAASYLALNPDLKSDGSWGMLPAGSDSGCDAGSDPYANVVSVSKTLSGEMPISCGLSKINKTISTDRDEGAILRPTCVCKAGGVSGTATLGKKMLEMLISLEKAKQAKKIPQFRVVTLMGGIQVQGSEHYSGRSVDIVPMKGSSLNTNGDDWIKLAKYIAETFKADVNIEYFKYPSGKWNGLAVVTNYTYSYVPYTQFANANDLDFDEVTFSNFTYKPTSRAGAYIYAFQYDPSRNIYETYMLDSDKIYDMRIHVNY